MTVPSIFFAFKFPKISASGLDRPILLERLEQCHKSKADFRGQIIFALLRFVRDANVPCSFLGTHGGDYTPKRDNVKENAMTLGHVPRVFLLAGILATNASGHTRFPVVYCVK
jgi:hypothetical protein